MARKLSEDEDRYEDKGRDYDEIGRGSKKEWWVFEPTSRTLFGPELTDQDAYNIGLAKFPGGDFEVHNLHTCNKAEASSRIKGKQFADPTKTFEESTKRLRHKYKRSD